MVNMVNMIKLVEELKGKNITLLDMDNTLGVERSIFDYSENTWNHGDNSAFAYTYKGEEYNVYFKVVEEKEDTTETIVEVTGEVEKI